MAYLDRQGEGGQALLLALLALLAFGGGTSGRWGFLRLDMDLYIERNRMSVIEGRRKPQDTGRSRRQYTLRVHVEPPL